ncbi:MAG: glycoside hydrolase family 38 C-terminal domain-containing protein [Spirochaetota bacterium]
MYHLQFPQIIGRAEQTRKRLQRELFIAAKPLQLRYAVTEKHLDFQDKDSLEYQEAPEGGGGFVWGRSADLVWRSAWFHAQADLIEELAQWQKMCREQGLEIALDLSFSGEGLVFNREGQIIQGISGGSVLHHDFQRSLLMRAEHILENGRLEIWIEAAANTLFGLERDDDPRLVAPRLPHYYGEHQGKVHSARLVLFDRPLWQYLLDLESATQLAKNLLHSKAAENWGLSDTHLGQTATPRAKRLIYGIEQSLRLLAIDRSNLREAHRLLRGVFINGNAPSDLQTVAVGHAHIDTAWLWPVAETVRKCARTFANQLRLLEHYPSYIFGASGAQHYAFMKDRYPEIYSQIKRRVREGRWEIQGAMWVEADANIPSGESLVRQLLYGKNFFMDEFGVDVRNLWLPDVFGYSANLPQLLKRAGVDYFLTQKLSWSQYNDFPHHTFHWKGVDGSSVLTHFPPEATYNSTLTLGGIHGLGLSAAQNVFKESYALEEFMTLYGVGDGGGGPDEAMIERGLSLAEGAENTPQVVFGRADAFFERLRQKAELLPSWVGELYLELHRGTLTSQARTKRGNRRLEQALQHLEYLYSLGDIKNYPDLDALWKVLLLNQFHDIIPGSSIHEVYARAEEEYAEALAACEALREQWAERHLDASAKCTLVNPFSLPLQLVLRLPAGWKGGQICRQEQPNEGSKSKVLGCEAGKDGAALLLHLAPQDVLVLEEAAPTAIEHGVAASEGPDGFCLENALVRYRFKRSGQLTEALDKVAGREILAAGGLGKGLGKGLGNCLRLYRDWPCDWDAWEIDMNYRAELFAELAAEEAALLPGNSLRRSLHFSYTCGVASNLTQTVSLEANSRRLDFHCGVAWRERHTMLRVSFELNVHAERARAHYDIQYACLERPAHRNTSWEMAQFEVLGQRFADLSDGNGGAALLNDCKYGYLVEGQTLDLNLLRSPTLPDPDADLGEQIFRYSLLPHEGSLERAMPQVQAEAALLSWPTELFEPLAGAPKLALIPPLCLRSEGVTLEVLKKAEKQEGLIVRMVERAGRMSKAYFSLPEGRGFRFLQECDLMEWEDIGSPLAAGELLFSPFAVRTFRLLK